MKQKTFLICILNWGLGHASRCIPIIEFLLQKNHKVIVASSGLSLQWLKNELKIKTEFLQLPDYNINYGNANLFFFTMMMQIPKILNAINNEKKIINDFINNNEVDLIISDNRFGCYSKEIPSYFLTHQLYIKLNSPYQFLENTLAKLNFHFINKFDRCFIIDEEKSLLSNELSNTTIKKNKPKIKVDFIGALSRIKLKPEIYNQNKKDVLIIISGPEPQRTNFENIIINSIENLKTERNFILIRGSNKSTLQTNNENLEIINLANSETVSEYLNKYQNIICRSGYSTILDLFAINKKAVLVPTPKQSEQLYLAKHLNKKFDFKIMQQQNFDMEKAIDLFDEQAFVKDSNSNSTNNFTLLELLS